MVSMQSYDNTSRLSYSGWCNGQLTYSPNFQWTYYHLNIGHIAQKIPLFSTNPIVHCGMHNFGVLTSDKQYVSILEGLCLIICLSCLRTLYASRAYVLTNFTHLRALHTCVPSWFCFVRVPSFFAFLTCPHVFKCLTCLHFFMRFTCLHFRTCP